MDEDAYLGIISLARTEQSFQRIVSRYEKASKVHEKLASNIEEDKKEVDADEAEKGVDFGHGSLLFKIVEHGIFGQLDRRFVNILLWRGDTG